MAWSWSCERNSLACSGSSRSCSTVRVACSFSTLRCSCSRDISALIASCNLMALVGERRRDLRPLRRNLAQLLQRQVTGADVVVERLAQLGQHGLAMPPSHRLGGHRVGAGGRVGGLGGGLRCGRLRGRGGRSRHGFLLDGLTGVPTPMVRPRANKRKHPATNWTGRRGPPTGPETVTLTTRDRTGGGPWRQRSSGSSSSTITKSSGGGRRVTEPLQH